MKEIYSKVDGEGVLEIHIITEEEFNDWYRKFLREDYKQL